MRYVNFTLGIVGLLGLIVSLLPPPEKSPAIARIEQSPQAGDVDQLRRAYLRQRSWTTALQISGVTLGLTCVACALLLERRRTRR